MARARFVAGARPSVAALRARLLRVQHRGRLATLVIMAFPTRISLLLATVASAAFVHAQPGPAQQRPPAPAMIGAETPDADALAADMRLLASNPQNLTALIDGAELTLKLGDPTAAAALYGRAEKVDPNNPRIKAGLGSLLVQAERPGEALRRFAEAASLGLDPRRFAADRGLAYDLIGEQERAQRDYRLVLKDGPNETVTLRYALSLGISGDTDRALTLIDPMVRANDRAAWRTRAFLMAMKGDAAGAENIAKVMMPGGEGQGLQGFFDRLPNLSPIDRAFAVHFGETRATPERLADARLAPPLAALGPDPEEVQLAAASAKSEKKVEQREVAQADRKDRKKQKHGSETQVASVSVAPTAAPRPGFNDNFGHMIPPVVVGRPVTAPVAQLPVQTASRLAPPAETNTRVAASTAQPTAIAPAARTPSPAPVSLKPATPSPQPALAGSPPPSSVAAVPATNPAAGIPAQATASGQIAVAAAMPAAPEAKPPTLAGATDTPPRPVEHVEPARVTPVPAHGTPGRIGGEDSILARIVANISVPATELGVHGPETPAAAATPAPAPSPAPAETVPVKKPEPSHAVPARPAESATASSEPNKKGERGASARSEDQSGAATDRTRAGRKGAKSKADADQDASDDKPIDPKAAAKKAAADKKAAAAKKAAAEQAAADKKAKDEERAEEKANPARVWVQVAGGAHEGDLPKAWKATKGKAPKALGSRSGWTTPLRATNRVLAGPFKTTEEAQDFVNQLAKEGVSGFVFTSDKGQKISKLPTK
jgi:Flp pilus assembly protein TadD